MLCALIGLEHGLLHYLSSSEWNWILQFFNYVPISDLLDGDHKLLRPSMASPWYNSTPVFWGDWLTPTATITFRWKTKSQINFSFLNGTHLSALYPCRPDQYLFVIIKLHLKEFHFSAKLPFPISVLQLWEHIKTYFWFKLPGDLLAFVSYFSWSSFRFVFSWGEC